MLYRYRYAVVIGLFAITLIGLLIFRTDLAPTGLSHDEMNSAVKSATFQLQYPLAQSIVDAPYRLLQKATLSLIGITDLAIIMPSLVLGIGTGVAFVMMVRRWFRMNVAIITSFIFITSAAFLTLARTGTPMIMTTFWLSIILLAITNILHPESKSKVWVAVLLFAVPLSLYTPLMIYPLLSIAIAGILHPHVRFVARRQPIWHYAAATAIVIGLMTPLAISVQRYPTELFELAGIPAQWPSTATLGYNLKVIVKSIFNIASAVVGTIPQPIFGAASLIIIALGFFKTVADRFSARSYMLLIWTAFVIPLVIVNPDKLLICLVPAYLFMAIGVETLIREWYKLFPLNPYARLAGLLPLIILLGGIMLSNTAQYFYGYFYGTPNVQYKEQLPATRKVLSAAPNTPWLVVAQTSEYSFYDLLRRDYPKLRVGTALNDPVSVPTIVHDGASYAIEKAGTPKRIITSYKKNQDQVILRTFAP